MKFHDALALMAGEACLQVLCTASLAQVREGEEPFCLTDWRGLTATQQPPMSWLDAMSSTDARNTSMATWLVKDTHLFTLFKDEQGTPLCSPTRATRSTTRGKSGCMASTSPHTWRC